MERAFVDVLAWYPSAGTAKGKSALLPKSARVFIVVAYDVEFFCGHPKENSAIAVSCCTCGYGMNVLYFFLRGCPQSAHGTEKRQLVRVSKESTQ